MLTSRQRIPTYSSWCVRAKWIRQKAWQVAQKIYKTDQFFEPLLLL